MASRYENKILARNASLVCREEFDDFHCTYFTTIDYIPSQVAPFSKSEIQLGRRLGTGAFAEVYEIRCFALDSNLSAGISAEEKSKRLELAQNPERYVLKQLKSDIETSSDYIAAVKDITYESEVLSALDHPNIVKLHGICASRHDAFLVGANEFFLIIDKIEETMDDKLRPSKNCGENSTKRSSILKRRLNNLGSKKVSPSSTRKSFEDRLLSSVDLASALEYLHQNNIIYRDLKSNNIGVDFQGKLKLFDFGLCRILPSTGDANDVAFEMSGAGTPRYTSPEVLLLKPYNLKADVYSYSIVLWELLTTNLPFPEYDHIGRFLDAVIVQDERPPIDESWPLQIQEIMRQCFSGNWEQRPTMAEVHRILENVLRGIKLANSELHDSVEKTGVQFKRSISLSASLKKNLYFRRNTSSTLVEDPSNLGLY